MIVLKKIKKELILKIKNSKPGNKKRSILFFTFHKCASTMFSEYVLRNIKGFQHIDYADYLWYKPVHYNKPLKFKPTGFIYGPIRLSQYNGIVYDLLLKPTIEPNFLRDKVSIFFIRDPRDILISSYYSYGFTHPLNPVKEKKTQQLQLRQEIQSLTLDEYVLKFADEQIDFFNSLKAVASSCEQKVILKYEDMVTNFDAFILDLKKVVELEDEVIEEFFNISRPRKVVDHTSHRRSGEISQYKKELKQQTIDLLNQKLDTVLADFGYQ
jgi:hypothetical protein